MKIINPPRHDTTDGAKKLVQRIEEYWRERGGFVRCRLEQREYPDGKVAADKNSSIAVRSDMTGGLPRAYLRG